MKKGFPREIVPWTTFSDFGVEKPNIPACTLGSAVTVEAGCFCAGETAAGRFAGVTRSAGKRASFAAKTTKATITTAMGKNLLIYLSRAFACF
jgi:hypothetical protein